MISHQKHIENRIGYEKKQEVIQAFDRWLKKDASSAIAASDWTVLDATDAVSSRAATTLTPQSDSSILASGKAPAKETYTVKANTGLEEIQFVRVEALTHQSMKRKGPGRAGNGNFALSHFKVYTVTSDEKKQHQKLISPKATHQQNTKNLSVAASIDGDVNGTGWAVDKGGIGKRSGGRFRVGKTAQTQEGRLHSDLNSGFPTMGNTVWEDFDCQLAVKWIHL